MHTFVEPGDPEREPAGPVPGRPLRLLLRHRPLPGTRGRPPHCCPAKVRGPLSMTEPEGLNIDRE